MADEKKTLKFQMMMSPSEAEVLDDWMFKNRMRSRAEAIRRLTQMGMVLDRRLDEASQTMSKAQDIERNALLSAAKAVFTNDEAPPQFRSLVLRLYTALLDEYAEKLTIVTNMMTEVSPLKSNIPIEAAEEFRRKFQEILDKFEPGSLEQARQIRMMFAAYMSSKPIVDDELEGFDLPSDKPKQR